MNVSVEILQHQNICSSPLTSAIPAPLAPHFFFPLLSQYMHRLHRLCLLWRRNDRHCGRLFCNHLCYRLFWHSEHSGVQYAGRGMDLHWLLRRWVMRDGGRMPVVEPDAHLAFPRQGLSTHMLVRDHVWACMHRRVGDVSLMSLPQL